MTKFEEIDFILQSESLDDLIENIKKIKFLDVWDTVALKKIWLKNNNLTLNDFYARKRENQEIKERKHDYKKLKEYRKERNKEINSNATNYLKKWEEEEIKEFLILNSFLNDLELAKYFKRSVYSISGQRRKLSIIRIILKKQKHEVKKIIELMLKSEQSLKKIGVIK